MIRERTALIDTQEVASTLDPLPPTRTRGESSETLFTPGTITVTLTPPVLGAFQGEVRKIEGTSTVKAREIEAINKVIPDGTGETTATEMATLPLLEDHSINDALLVMEVSEVHHTLSADVPSMRKRMLPEPPVEKPCIANKVT